MNRKEAAGYLGRGRAYLDSAKAGEVAEAFGYKLDELEVRVLTEDDALREGELSHHPPSKGVVVAGSLAQAIADRLASNVPDKRRSYLGHGSSADEDSRDAVRRLRVAGAIPSAHKTALKAIARAFNDIAAGE